MIDCIAHDSTQSARNDELLLETQMSNGTPSAPQPRARRKPLEQSPGGPRALGHLFTHLIPHFTFEWPAAIACAMFLGLFVGVSSQTGFWSEAEKIFGHLMTRRPPPAPVCYGSVLVVAANPQGARQLEIFHGGFPIHLKQLNGRAGF